MTNQNGIDLIKTCEGFKKEVYICPGGFPTIGYGHKLLPGEQYSCVSREAAEQLLVKDLYNFENAVTKYIVIELNDNQFAALVSFAFNVGVESFRKSTLKNKLNLGLYNIVSLELLKWTYIKKIKSEGLIVRRTLEAQLFNSSC